MIFRKTKPYEKKDELELPIPTGFMHTANIELPAIQIKEEIKLAAAEDVYQKANDVNSATTKTEVRQALLL